MRLVNSDGMSKFLRQIESTPCNYKRVFLCTPFVSVLHENIDMGLLLTGAEIVDRELIQKMELKLTQIDTNGRKVSGNEHIN